MSRIYPSKTKPTKVCCPWVKGYKIYFISYCLRCIHAYKLFRCSKLEAVENGKGTSYSNWNHGFMHKRQANKQNICPKPIGYIFKQLTYLPNFLTCWFDLILLIRKWRKIFKNTPKVTYKLLPSFLTLDWFSENNKVNLCACVCVCVETMTIIPVEKYNYYWPLSIDCFWCFFI